MSSDTESCADTDDCMYTHALAQSRQNVQNTSDMVFLPLTTYADVPCLSFEWVKVMKLEDNDKNQPV